MCGREESEGRGGRGRGIHLGPAHTPLTLFSHSRSQLCSHCSAVEHSKKGEKSVSGSVRERDPRV